MSVWAPLPFFFLSRLKAAPRGPLGPPEMGRPKLWPPGRHPAGMRGRYRSPNRNSALVLSLSGPALLLPIRTLPSRIRAPVLTVYDCFPRSSAVCDCVGDQVAAEGIHMELAHPSWPLGSLRTQESGFGRATGSSLSWPTSWGQRCSPTVLPSLSSLRAKCSRPVWPLGLPLFSCWEAGTQNFALLLNPNPARASVQLTWV